MTTWLQKSTVITFNNNLLSINNAPHLELYKLYLLTKHKACCSCPLRGRIDNLNYRGRCPFTSNDNRVCKMFCICLPLISSLLQAISHFRFDLFQFSFGGNPVQCGSIQTQSQETSPNHNENLPSKLTIST